MLPHRHIRSILQALYGLLLICWPVLDTAPTGSVTIGRITLGGGMLLLLVAAIITAGTQKRPVRWNPTDWAMLAYTMWYIGNVIFIGCGQTDPYNLLNGFVILVAYAFCRMAGISGILPALLVSGLIQAGTATAQLCGIIATRHFYYDLTGSFPNPGPLGGWLCIAALAAAVLTLRLWKNGRKASAALCTAGGLYIGVILLMTDSRAAWLGFAAGIFWILSTLKFRNKRPIMLSLVGIALAGACFLYGYKKDSADGRLLVWRVSADMIAQRPIIGSGIGTFPERYMFAQADYFERHPDTRFTGVADQVSYPFNELVGVVCEQGIVGGLLLLFLVGTAILRPRKTVGKVLLVGLIVFSLFSYPSAFLSFGLLFSVALANCGNGSGRQFSCRVAVVTAGMILVAGGAFLYSTYAERDAPTNRYALLCEASDLMRRSEQVDLPRLEQLAKRLPIAGFYTDLGDLCLEAGDAGSAKGYYRKAAYMIPSRLRPYDGLFRTYLQTGQTDSAALLARQIFTMSVKVNNTATIRIRQSAKEWLQTHNPDL